MLFRSFIVPLNSNKLYVSRSLEIERLFNVRDLVLSPSINQHGVNVDDPVMRQMRNNGSSSANQFALSQSGNYDNALPSIDRPRKVGKIRIER